MRTKLFFPLILALLVGCEGRYDLGNLQDASGGTSGSNGSSSGNGGGVVSNGNGGSAGVGASADAGNGGNGVGTSGSHSGGAPNTGGAAGKAGSSGNAGSAGAGGAPVTGSRSWLAVMSFVSTTSSETALSFIDLNDPKSTLAVTADDLIVVDKDHGDGFSPDGRWFVYRVYRNPNYQVNIVRTGNEIGTPVILGTVATTSSCRWAPDSSRIACAVIPTSDDDPRDAVIALADMSGESAAPLQTLALGKPELAFLDRSTVAYGAAYETQKHYFVRGTFDDLLTLQTHDSVGTADGLIVQQSPDLKRGFVKGLDTDSPGEFLIDFTTGDMGVVGSNLAFSLAPSFATGFASTPNAADSTLTDYVYFAIDGVHLNQVGTDTAPPGTRGTNPSSQLFDHTLVHMNGDLVKVVNIGATSVSEHNVPGALQNVNTFALSSNEQSLYLGTWSFDAQNAPIDSSGQLWLSHISADGPGTAQLLDSGFIGSYAYFSPDGHFLVVHGYAPLSPSAVQFRLFDLRGATPKAYPLDTPTNWSFTGWSPDSTHLSFIGGDPTTSTRPLYVVDALSPTTAPRLIQTCGPHNATSPTCPNSAYFQP